MKLSWRFSPCICLRGLSSVSIACLRADVPRRIRSVNHYTAMWGYGIFFDDVLSYTYKILDASPLRFELYLNYDEVPWRHSSWSDIGSQELPTKDWMTSLRCASSISHVGYWTIPAKTAENLVKTVLRGCIQKFPDWVDNEIYAYNNKHSLRSNTKGYDGKTH
jgi:hypothetical protein